MERSERKSLGGNTEQRREQIVSMLDKFIKTKEDLLDHYEEELSTFTQNQPRELKDEGRMRLGKRIALEMELQALHRKLLYKVFQDSLSQMDVEIATAYGKVKGFDADNCTNCVLQMEAHAFAVLRDMMDGRRYRAVSKTKENWLLRHPDQETNMLHLKDYLGVYERHKSVLGKFYSNQDMSITGALKYDGTVSTKSPAQYKVEELLMWRAASVITAMAIRFAVQEYKGHIDSIGKQMKRAYWEKLVPVLGKKTSFASTNAVMDHIKTFISTMKGQYEEQFAMFNEVVEDPERTEPASQSSQASRRLLLEPASQSSSQSSQASREPASQEPTKPASQSSQASQEASKEASQSPQASQDSISASLAQSQQSQQSQQFPANDDDDEEATQTFDGPDGDDDTTQPNGAGTGTGAGTGGMAAPPAPPAPVQEEAAAASQQGGAEGAIKRRKRKPQSIEQAMSIARDDIERDPAILFCTHCDHGRVFYDFSNWRRHLVINDDRIVQYVARQGNSDVQLRRPHGFEKVPAYKKMRGHLLKQGHNLTENQLPKFYQSKQAMYPPDPPPDAADT